MFELIMPFILPGLGAGLAWLIGLEKKLIALVFVAILLLQFILIVIRYFYKEVYRKWPSERPNCRCGHKLKSTRHGRPTVRCPSCGKIYGWCLDKFQEIHKNRQVVPYLKVAPWGKWVIDKGDHRPSAK